MGACGPVESSVVSVGVTWGARGGQVPGVPSVGSLGSLPLWWLVRGVRGAPVLGSFREMSAMQT
jgi:hypothetical protein